MATTNTTLPIDLRGGFVPVLRYGNYAGPGYAGGLGAETTITDPNINGGKPILASVLTQTPQGLASFMKLALQTEPNGYLDTVTRNHDVEYTVAEMRFMTKVQEQLGKLPHELTAQDRQDPAYQQLETARDGEYWQADQRMLTSMAQYKPTDFVDSTYRDAALTAFYVKAESGMVGYGLGQEATDFYKSLKSIDNSITTPTTGQALSALGTANSLARSDFETLATLPISPQERQFFNSHLKPGQYLDTSNKDANGNPITYDSKDSTNRIVVPEVMPDGRYFVRTQIGGDTVTMVLDKRDPLNPVFTKETVHNGQVVSTETIKPADTVKEGETTARAYESMLTDGAGHVIATHAIAKPDIPDSTSPPDLQQKIDAVKSGDVAQILSVSVAHSPSGADGSDAHFNHRPPTSTTPEVPDGDPSASEVDGSDTHFSHYQPQGDEGYDTHFANHPPTQDGAEDGSDAHFNHHSATSPGTTLQPDLTEDQANQLSQDLGLKTASASGSGVLLADAGNSGVVSDAGPGYALNLQPNQPPPPATPAQPATNSIAPSEGQGIDSAGQSCSARDFTNALTTADSNANPNDFNHFVAGAGTSLTTKQRDALEGQLDALHLGGDANLSFIRLPNGDVIIANADGEPVGSLTRAPDGELHLQSNGIDTDGNPTQVDVHVSSQGQVTDYSPYQLGQVNAALSLVQGLDGLQHWDQMGDLGHFQSLMGLANNLNTLNNNALNLGPLNEFSGYLNLAQALESGNALGVLSSVNSLSNGAIDGALNEALGSTGVPYLSVIMALNDFEHHPGQSIGALVGMCFGPVGSMLGGMIGGLLDSAGMFGGHDNPPPPQGEVHYTWDADGNMCTVVEKDVRGGGDTAHQMAEHVQIMLEELVAQHNAQGGEPLAINPYMMPKLSYAGNNEHPDLASGVLSIPTFGGGEIAVRLDAPDFAKQLLQALQDNGGIAPQWEVDTQKLRFETALHNGQSLADVEAEMRLGVGGGQDIAFSEAHALQGNAAESADFKSQSFGTLVVHLDDNPHVQAAQARLNEVLRDVEGDGYLEKTESIAARDGAGSLQALLTLDFNGDGQIETRDILNLGGNQSTDNPTGAAQLAAELAGQQRNNIEWLDANGDGVINKRDPAFAAIKLWVDMNEDGAQQSGEATTLDSLHIQSINFRTGEVTYEDGHTDTLTAQTLKADTEGVRLTQITEVNPDGTLHAIDAGTVLEHEGYQGQVQVTDEAGTRWGVVREATFEQVAVRTGDWEGTDEQDAHRHGGGNVEDAPTETEATGAVSYGGVKTQPPVSAAPARTVTAEQVRSPVAGAGSGNDRVVFVPLMDSAQQIRNVTAGMIQTLEDNSLGALGVNLATLAMLAAGSTQAAAEVMVKAEGDAAARRGVAEWALGADAVVIPSSIRSSQSEVGSTSTAPGAEAPQARGQGSDAGMIFERATVQTDTSGTSAPVHMTTDGQMASPSLTLPLEWVASTGERMANGVAAPSSAVSVSQPDSAPVVAAGVPQVSTLLIDYPVVQGETVAGLEDVVMRIPGAMLVANDSTPNAAADATQPVLSVTAVGNAQHGQVSLAGDVVVFTPEANYHGPASFSYTVTDQYGLSRTTTADLNIGAVNDAPVTQGELVGGTEDTGLLFSAAQLLANDTDVDTVTDGQTLSISRVGGATHGTVSLDAQGDIRYVPDTDYNGMAQFTYWVSDGNGGETPATVRVNLAAVNDLPVVQGELVNSDEDVVLRFVPADLLANDSDVDVAMNGQVLNVSSVGNARHGTVGWVTLQDGTQVIEFTPQANYHGVAAYDYTVSDGNGGEVTTTVVLNLAAVNDAPLAMGGEEIDSNEDQPLIISAAGLLANDSDVDVTTDGQTLSLSRVGNATHGAVSLNANGDVVFTPKTDYNGPVTFTYWVKDDAGGESQGVTATINLAPVNDAPGAQGETLAGASEDALFNIQAATLLANDHDIDNPDSDLRLSWVGNAQHGSVSLDASGNVVFTPAANFNGYASFSYRVRDLAGLESPDVQAIFNVAAVNDVPVAVDDRFATYRNSTMTIAFDQLVSNDVDVDHDALAVSGVRNAVHGSVSIVNGEVQFVPTTDFRGVASFEYLCDDSHGGQSWATATVDVKLPPNLYPTVTVTAGGYSDQWYGGSAYYNPVAVWQNFSYQINDESPGGVQVQFVERVGNLVAGTFQANTFQFYEYDGWGADGVYIQFDIVLTDQEGIVNTTHVSAGYDLGAIGHALTGFSTSTDHTGLFISPVVLDLNGDGVRFNALATSKVTFDMDGDGIGDRASWASNDDGVLVWDKDHNGHISDAGEFSFQALKAGAKTDMEGLQALDTSGNGQLDAGDERFAEFGVWRDANGNGVTDAGEFRSLADLGIVSINLHSNAQMHNAGSDVVVMGEATFTRTDGSTGAASDAMFAFQSAVDAQVQAQAQLQHAQMQADNLTAELNRQALLFNQFCNTAGDSAPEPLGFVPIVADGQNQEVLVAVNDPHLSALQAA